MVGARPAISLFILLILGVAVLSCGSDRGTPSTGGPATEPTSTTLATVTPPATGETHPLTRVSGGFPDRSALHPTSTPGPLPEYERNTDSFPGEVGRPYLDVEWNVPVPVATADERGLVELLQHIPEAAGGSEVIQLMNHELWLSLTGIEKMEYSDGEDAYLDALIEWLETNELHHEHPLLFVGAGEGPYLSGFYRGSPEELNTYGSMGFDQRNMVTSALVRNGPDAIEVLVGSYDPREAHELLTTCDECIQPHTTTSYGGYEYWSFGNGAEGDLSRRHTAPIFDHLGRGGHILITETGVYRTFTVDSIELLIDSLNGDLPSMHGSFDYRTMMGIMGAYHVMGVTLQDSSAYAAEEVLPDGEGVLYETQKSGEPRYSVSRESNRANALLAPLLASYESVAFGTSSDGPVGYEVVVIEHATAEGAEENARRLADRLVNSNSADGLPWAFTYSGAEISVTGNLVVARLFSDGPANLKANSRADLLFAHE